MRRAALTLLLFLLTGLLQAQAGYFWDDPQYIVRQGGSYPSAVDNGKTAAAFWQERRQTDGWPQAYLSVSIRNVGDKDWTIRRNVLGPFTQVGADVQFYSAVLTKAGVFWIAVLENDGQVVVYRSTDNAVTFQVETRFRSGSLLDPRLFLGVDDEPVLTVNQAEGVTFRIAAARRSGGSWSPLKVVTAVDTQRQSFQPSVLLIGDKLIMVYQSQITGRRLTYQIFRQDSDDGGLTWTNPVRLSNFADELAADPDEIINQRPAVFSFEGRLFVAWERQRSDTQSVIEAVSYGSDGRRIDNIALTTSGYSARKALFYTFRDRLYLAWFDNRNETYDVFQSVWGLRDGWENAVPLSKDTGNSVFGQPARLGEDLYFFWQNNFAENPGIVMLQPDRRADAPTLRPLNFKVGVKTNKPDFAVEVVYPKDISGIAAFNTLLTQDPAAEPDHERKITSKDRQYSVNVPQEGTWYLAVSVLDLAGNWSPAAHLPLELKTTPPGPVLFDTVATDARGFLLSNTFRLSWKPTSSDTVAYSWRMARLGDFPLTQNLLASMKNPEPALNPLGTDTSAGGQNFEDGLWGLSVASFDEAGNRGPATTMLFRMNKFVPSTVLQFVDTKQDAFGRVELAIHGRGFTAGGSINHVYIDRDGKAPWDYDLGPSRFRLPSDRLVDGIKVEGLAEGVYRIGVNHPDRGIVFTGPVLKVEPTGTVKIGDYRNLDQTVWVFFQGVRFFFSVHALYFWVLMLLLAAVGVVSARLLMKTWADKLRIDHQAAELFTDNPEKWARRARSKAMKTKGLSLSFKFAASILGLTATVILMLSLTLGFFITETSQQALGTALQQRTQVLLDSLANGARTYVQSQTLSELGFLPAQISAMPDEALYATITGPSTDGRSGNSFVYVSNDPDLSSKIDTPALKAGVSVLKDKIEDVWPELRNELNQKAEAAVGDLVRQIEALTKVDAPLSAKLNRTAEEDATFRQNEVLNSSLKRQVVTKLTEVAGQARSLPEFVPSNLVSSKNKRYVFYQPYAYRADGDPTYVRGLIRIEVSSVKIEQQIADSRNQLIQVTAIIAAIALVLGLIGAFILSALTLNPIRKLATGVAKIRDTQDKTELAGHVIDVKSRDELEDLASTVNQMTRGLVEGANRTQDLTKGKVEQKTLFIPLDKDKEAEQKLTTFNRDLPDIEVFAYYEGAKLVSGDLYEFRQLDTQNGKNKDSPWYGIMKGDVSGKGVEAGMIMAIAAMFVTTFFRQWTAAKDARDTKVQALLYQVNDTIEPILAEAGRGLFVALNVGILNAKTGALRFSQAGDNILHIWRGREGRFEAVDLKKTVSVGAMPSEDHGIRYENRDLVLERGDTLLYFTDGIEESQAAFRNAAWEPVAYFDPEDPSTQTFPGDRKQVPVFEGGPLRDIQAIATEDFGPERMEAVIEAYYHNQIYELKRKNWAHPEQTYHFDFRSCDGSAAGLVTAMISLDRIFRLVPDPKATEDDYIDLDLVQDEFLKKHFVEYDQYFKNGFRTYEQGDPSKSDAVDAEGFKLKGAKRVPLWEKGAAGDAVDAEGYKLVDGDRVQRREVVNGREVPAFERGNAARKDVVDAEGYRLVGGQRIQQNPGYIRYTHLIEDHQFDDLTLLAIKRK